MESTEASDIFSEIYLSIRTTSFAETNCPTPNSVPLDTPALDVPKEAQYYFTEEKIAYFVTEFLSAGLLKTPEPASNPWNLKISGERLLYLILSLLPLLRKNLGIQMKKPPDIPLLRKNLGTQMFKKKPPDIPPLSWKVEIPDKIRMFLNILPEITNLKGEEDDQQQKRKELNNSISSCRSTDSIHLSLENNDIELNEVFITSIQPAFPFHEEIPKINNCSERYTPSNYNILIHGYDPPNYNISQNKIIKEKMEEFLQWVETDPNQLISLSNTIYISSLPNFNEKLSLEIDLSPSEDISLLRLSAIKYLFNKIINGYIDELELINKEMKHFTKGELDVMYQSKDHPLNSFLDITKSGNKMEIRMKGITIESLSSLTEEKVQILNLTSVSDRETILTLQSLPSSNSLWKFINYALFLLTLAMTIMGKNWPNPWGSTDVMLNSKSGNS